MKAWHYMNEDNVRDLAGDALNVACKHIQDIIGVETGDLAGMYFSGSVQDEIEAALREYIIMELQEKNPELHKFLGELNRAAQ